MTNLLALDRLQGSVAGSARHLSRSALDLWKPRPSEPGTAHLLQCAACRKELGKRLILRALLRSPEAPLAGKHPTLADWERLHDFLFGYRQTADIPEREFLNLFNHLERCETCFEVFYCIHEIRKNTAAAFNQFMRTSPRRSATSAPEYYKPRTDPKTLKTNLGSIHVRRRARGLSIEFRSGHGGVGIQMPDLNIPPERILMEPKAGAYYRDAISIKPSARQPSGLPDLKILNSLELSLSTRRLRLSFTQEENKLRLEFRSLDDKAKQSSPALRISCTPAGDHSGDDRGSLSASLGKSGIAVLELPASEPSAPAHGAVPQSDWVLEFDERGGQWVQLMLRLSDSGSRVREA